MTDIYKWWSKKELKDEILKLKLTYNELFDAMKRTQEENRGLQKNFKLIEEANDNLRTNNINLRKQLNDRSYVRLEEQLSDLENKLTEAKEIIRELLYCTDGITEIGIPEENRTLHVKKLKVKAEAFLKE